ncbi:MAG: hypothetical protein DI498_03335 [Paracoccus denitrificans]|nr:MAG: hypothetical protein DI498_03335 [Paracoccus denitrificans]PZO85561.1 MAG: hypothetical protein DI633_03335 [Paracoccus denitrificans]
MSDRVIEITELDKRLVNDTDGVELKRLLDKLSAGRSVVVQEMNRGVGPDQYARLSLLADAYSSGIEALPKLWAEIND